MDLASFYTKKDPPLLRDQHSRTWSKREAHQFKREWERSSGRGFERHLRRRRRSILSGLHTEDSVAELAPTEASPDLDPAEVSPHFVTFQSDGGGEYSPHLPPSTLLAYVPQAKEAALEWAIGSRGDVVLFAGDDLIGAVSMGAINEEGIFLDEGSVDDAMVKASKESVTPPD
ncbi:hypothetical protein Taro_046811 [Colocasia esculenta]|uniref:Uncharacterized protein n=1 Tax=Colocasia esculenta TaxID=4460 RepID=A0A843X7M0_COLES|nr:hypothetical protein [Colocasia esculenta]